MSTPTDDLLRALLDQLTPGPWIETRPQDDQLYDIHHKYDMLAEAIERREDAEFIAAAPSLVADLLARATTAAAERDDAVLGVEQALNMLAEARGEIQQLRTALEEIRNQDAFGWAVRIATEALAAQLQELEDLGMERLGQNLDAFQSLNQKTNEVLNERDRLREALREIEYMPLDGGMKQRLCARAALGSTTEPQQAAGPEETQT